MELVHRPCGVGAVEDIAVNGVGTRRVELRQRVAGAGHAWGDGDISYPQWPHFARIAQRIGSRLQIETRQVDGRCAAQQ